MKVEEIRRSFTISSTSEGSIAKASCDKCSLAVCIAEPASEPFAIRLSMAIAGLIELRRRIIVRSRCAMQLLACVSPA